MAKDSQGKLALLFKESFLPVVLVAIALAAILVYVNFKAAMDADQAEVIVIQQHAPASDSAEAEQGLEQVAIEINGARKANPLYEKAARAVSNKNWQAAEKIYLQILQEQPTSQAFNDLGVLYYNQKKYKQALEQFDKALAQPRIYVNAYVNRGLVYTRLKQFDKAEADYRAAIKKVPYHYQAHLNLGVVLIKAEKYPDAVTVLKKTSTLAGGSRKAKALYNLAIAYRGMGREKYAAARKVLLAAIRIRPNYIEARFALAALEENTAEGRAKALEQYLKVLDLNPQYPLAYFRIAQLKAAGKDIKAAQQNYLKAIQYNPNYTKARYNLGLLYLSSKKWSDARNQFEQILQRGGIGKKETARVHFQLGRAAYGEKDYETALNEYDKALALRKGRYVKALLNKGLTYRAQKRYEKAIATYQQVLELDKEYPQAWYNLGLAYQRDKKYEQAEEALKKALKYKKNYASAWFNLGVLYRKQGRFDESIEAYKAALKIKPNYRKAKLNLAVRYAQKNQFQQAIVLYRDVLKQDDRYVTAWINLGIAQFSLKQNNEASSSLTRALELQPNSVKAKQYLSRIMIANRQYAEAIDLLVQAVESKQDDAQLRMDLGLAYKKAGKRALAATELNKALILDPGNPQIKAALKK
ncbi:MAG TPA: tetratricopeptide repeat protein [Gammaproteobacteria bacterium]|nr:tetratricopeptide repeat protein [Gammaproteobacteria bacterium]